MPARHVFEAELLGHELAVWQAADGTVNVWENRCPHRGMRLTLGANLGTELRCAYHGYRFVSASGACRSVPAQPERTPPRSLCVKVYPVREQDGLIWTRLTDGGTASSGPPTVAGETLALYSVNIRSSAQSVGSLLKHYCFRPTAVLLEAETADEQCSTAAMDAYSFRSIARTQAISTEVRLFTQPVDAQNTVVHGIVIGPIGKERQSATLRHHAQQLTRLRDASESLTRTRRGDEAIPVGSP